MNSFMRNAKDKNFVKTAQDINMKTNYSRRFSALSPKSRPEYDKKSTDKWSEKQTVSLIKWLNSILNQHETTDQTKYK